MTPQDLQAFAARANGAANLARQALDQAASASKTMQGVVASVQEQNKLLASLITRGQGRGDIERIEDLPGRRIPFDVVIEIVVGANTTSPLQQTYTVSQDGPFVAVSRSATFLSMNTFQVVADDGSVTTFNGRSYGRYRPIASVLDIMDAQGGFNNAAQAAAPGTGLMQVVSKTDKAGARTMCWDGTIKVSNTIFKRQSGDVPSSLFAPGFESSMQLPVLDYYDKGETIEVIAQPNHVNNPPFGNIQTVSGALPFLAGQFDAHEGIGYTAGILAGQADTIVRQPDGILVVVLHGFRIVSAPGVG